jgi:CPA2 family monovalent cation:H+ antiporter-2
MTPSPSSVRLGAIGATQRGQPGVSPHLQKCRVSFILATLGTHLGFFGEDATNAIVGTAIVSIALNAIIYKTVAPMDRWFFTRQRLWRLLNARVPASAPGEHEGPSGFDAAHRAVIVGHGPVGRTVARLLVEQGIEPTIIEMNLNTVRKLNESGTRAIFGDATLSSILEQAGVRTAGTLVLSVSGFTNAGEVIKMARDMNPHIHILARAAYLADIPALRAAGADRVFSGGGRWH